MMKIRVFNVEKQGTINEINLAIATAIDNDYIVGRSPQSGLILDSPDVSRQHGKFFLQNEDYYYCDLGSVNGSLINDKLAKTNQSYLLKSGDIVRIGEFVLILEAISEETEVLPATVLNSDWRSFLKLDSPEEVAEQASKPVSEVPELVTSESELLNLVPEELSQGKVTNVHVSEEAESEVMALTSEAVSEVYEPEKTYIQEMTSIQAPGEFEEVVVSEATMIQVPEELEEFPEEEEAQSHQVTSEAAPEAASSTLAEPVTQVPEAAVVSEALTQTPEEAESEVMAQTPETVSKAFEIISKKYIALMAHDSKKSELVQFVAQNQAFLSKCLTIATPSVSETLYQQAGLAISQKTPLVPVGGYQAIASLVGTGDLLAVVLLRDFMATQPSQANEEALLRLCNINQVLVATNVPTADAVMHYIKDMVTSL